MALSLTDRDISVIWHPYTQMETAPPPIPIVSGSGVLLKDENGKDYIDAISSWWVNIHGHSNKYIAEKIADQAQLLEHCIFAGFTHPPAVNLAERLIPHLPGNQSKIFYSDNGSTAVEVALKMAIQYWHNKGQHKPKLLAFKNAYHGDTFGAMSVSGRSIFTAAFDEYLFEVIFIDPPTDESPDLSELETLLEANEVAGFIFEPLLLGSGGMIMYNGEGLDKIIRLCRRNNVLIIADEVLTGFGRTGREFAMDYQQEKPDIICLSKGLTGGTMALGVTACTQDIYKAFLSQDKLKTLFHGHSFTANPIACATALASLDLFEDPSCGENIRRIMARHMSFAEKLKQYEQVKNVRQLGTIIAFEVKTSDKDSYVNQRRDYFYNFFLERNILLRPLGNTLYILPPYCISDEQLDTVYAAIDELMNAIS